MPVLHAGALYAEGPGECSVSSGLLLDTVDTIRVLCRFVFVRVRWIEKKVHANLSVCELKCVSATRQHLACRRLNARIEHEHAHVLLSYSPDTSAVINVEFKLRSTVDVYRTATQLFRRIDDNNNAEAVREFVLSPIGHPNPWSYPARLDWMTYTRRRTHTYKPSHSNTIMPVL